MTRDVHKLRYESIMPYRLLWLSLFASGLTACNMSTTPLPTPDAENRIYVTATVPLPTPNDDGVIVITATPQPQSASIAQGQSEQPVVQQNTAVSPPTAAPTNTQPSTPITQPNEALARAQQQVLNGYLDEAVTTYQAILSQTDLTLETRTQAAFALGQVAVRAGAFADAVDALSFIITNAPQPERVAQAYFLRGDAYLGLSEWQAAVADFEQYLSLRPGLVDSYALERIGDAQLALGLTDSALASYEQAIAANRTLVPQLVLREKTAQILISAGRVADAVAQYDAILEVARNAPYRASIDLLAARALIDGGQTELGLARARRVFDNYTTTASAFPAMELLLNNGAEIDGWRRGQVNFARGEYLDAIEAFNDFTSSTPLADIPPDLYLLLGRAYREIGNSDAAVVAFQTLLTQYPQSPLIGAALLEQGRTRFLAGDFEAAISTYLSIARDYSALVDTAAEAKWRAGYIYGTQLSDPVRSRETFVELAAEYPQSEWARSGLTIAASVAVANGETAVAENLYGRIAAIATGEEQATAYYWVGRLARQRGDIQASDEALRLARAAAPDSFFSVRANDLVIEREAFAPPAQLRFTFDEASDRAAAEAWLRSTFGLTQTGDLGQLSAELAADPRFVRGQELWTVAAYDEAQDEFDSILDEAREAGDVLRAYQMAIYLRDLGAYLPSIVAAADVIVAAQVPTLDAPAYIARMRYPAYYVDLVQPQAAQYGFDPLLMLALMRQESLFDATAVSIANAKGLTQVIPSTATYIAGQLNWPDFQDSDLFKPYVGVAFGAYYLDEQLRLFDGNKAAALAAYNAGPGYTLDWVRLSGGDVDALVATITFDETKRYVQRIYSHYTIYRALYGA